MSEAEGELKRIIHEMLELEKKIKGLFNFVKEVLKGS